MSTIRRITSGSLAGWMRMGLIMAGQLLTVPLYLSKWSASEYGAFLLAQAFVSILNTLDVGHQNYLGYRFIAHPEPESVSLETFSAIPFALILGAIQLIAAAICVKLNLFHLSGLTVRGLSLEFATSSAIMLLTLTWILTGGVGGIFGRSIAPYGHLPRLGWWNVLNAALQLTAPVAACLLGADVLTAVATLCCATLIYNALLYIDIAKLWKLEGLKPTRPDVRLGARNAWHALALVLREFFLQFRQQGVRTLLAPVVGTEALASFTITRTGANVALQGLSTLTTPLEPEVLRFVHQRKPEQLHLSLSLLIFFIVGIIISPTLPLQLLAPIIFSAWTHGKVPFDPVIFSLLSSTVVFFAISQPALIVVRGNNLLKDQLRITAISSLLALMGIFLMTPHLGLRGASISLLLAEAYAALHTISIARGWMRTNALPYPGFEFSLGVASAATVLAATLVIAVAPRLALAGFAAGAAVQLCLLVAIAHRLPKEAWTNIQRTFLRRGIMAQQNAPE